MYRINVLTRGKYNNVKRGYRYCFRKKSAIDMIDTFLSARCEITVEKLIRIHSDVFCWNDDLEDDKVFDHYFAKLYEEE
jgi:hypothetical protein